MPKYQNIHSKHMDSWCYGEKKNEKNKGKIVNQEIQQFPIRVK